MMTDEREMKTMRLDARELQGLIARWISGLARIERVEIEDDRGGIGDFVVKVHKQPRRVNGKGRKKGGAVS